MNKAFVIGNGRSRIGLDLETLRPAGKIFGCNALYRDFVPDVLVATDPGISAEIEETGYQKQNQFFTRKPMDAHSKKIPHNYGFSSGPVAATLAALEGFQRIYLIGFDLEGIQNRFNNVYADSAHYKMSTDDATYYGNWVDQIFKISREFNTCEFFRVGDNLLQPTQWQKRHNIQFLTVDQFLLEVNNISWQR